MKCALIFTLLAAVASTSFAAPFDLGDLFPGLRNAPIDLQQEQQQDVVKRQVVANPDSGLKQISFQGLIGDLENSLFQSALSLNGASAPDSHVAEVKPDQPESNESNVHTIAKRSTETAATTEAAALSEDAQERKILIQTTKKVPVTEEGPAHLIIDRVSVQPHVAGSVPLIPTFQVHHTKITSATILEDVNNDSSDGKQTKISITKTSITSTAPVESVEAQSTSSKPEVVSSSTTEQASRSSTSGESSSSSSTTTSTTTTSSTSEQPIVKLKQVEEKLKAKVAEVEAEPVILTARV